MQLNSSKALRLTQLHICAAAGLLAVVGCGQLHTKPADKYVYVTTKQTYLRDRVAAVSNRTGTVENGDKLVVLDHARRFIKVRTTKGEEGWIEEKLTADQALADEFDKLRTQHYRDVTVASATARDEVYLHIEPGRETAKFFRLNEGDKLSLLLRAAVAKPLPPGTQPAVAAPASAPVSAPAPAPAKTSGKSASSAKTAAPKDDAASSAAGTDALPTPVMEDWWLVRDAKGETGWIYSHLIDVDAPDALTRYAEGQRIVGAYILNKVDDPDSGMLDNGQPVTSIPEYVTVLGPYKAGLPFDFNQVRVFTWNLKKHRYETAFREHNIAGYMPVVIAMKADPYGRAANAVEPLPSFSYKVLAAGATPPVVDLTTGTSSKANLITKTYRLEGNICRRILPPGIAAPEETHPDPEPVKKDKAKKKK